MSLCKNCNKRNGTQDWCGDGGVIAWVHGLSARWCNVCVLTAQLKYAQERAAEIPKLETALMEAIKEAGVV